MSPFNNKNTTICRTATIRTQMLRYISSEELDGPDGGVETSVRDGSSPGVVRRRGLPSSDHSRLVTEIVVAETDVLHSGTYGCQPGDAPPAQVKVHVIDGKLPAAMQTAGGAKQLSFILLIATIILHTSIGSLNFFQLKKTNQSL